MRFTVIIAARTGSQRLPGKALLPLGGMPMIAYIIERLRSSRLIEDLVLATTEKAEDDPLAELAQKHGVSVFRGSENDLIARYVGACDRFNVDYAVRVTGDCPFVDATTLDYCLQLCRTHPTFDLATTKGLFPAGIDYEIVPADLLRRLNQQTDLSASHREHLTLYLYENASRYTIVPLTPPPELKQRNFSFLVDTQEDYVWCNKLTTQLSSGPWSLEDLLATATKVDRI